MSILNRFTCLCLYLNFRLLDGSIWFPSWTRQRIVRLLWSEFWTNWFAVQAKFSFTKERRYAKRFLVFHPNWKLCFKTPLIWNISLDRSSSSSSSSGGNSVRSREIFVVDGEMIIDPIYDEVPLDPYQPAVVLDHNASPRRLMPECQM